jgi:hypothetical protein
MPLPKPKPGESRNDFISRCVSDDNVQSEAQDNDQAVAICSSIWSERGINMPSINDQLIAGIKSREQKKTEFGYGILTADKYVRTIAEAAGTEACYKAFASKGASFDDVLKKAAKTLVYSNRDMIIEEQIDRAQSPIELPKNTLIAFRHTLTTPRKDRDGDILRTEGAIVDPKMLLLWQHVHTLPVGKMVSVFDHSKNKLSLISAIVDLNELAHDSAVMVDSDMARFSHGFRALQFRELKEDTETEQTMIVPGFDITKFEIMEESIVSVPSNVDAETEEVLLEMVEGGRLTSGIMKEIGKHIREHQTTTTVAVKGVEDADEPGSGSDEAEGSREESKDTAGPSEKADDDQEKETEDAGNAEVKAPETWTSTDEVEVEEKAGRVLSKANLQKLMDVRDDLTELNDKEDMSRGGGAICERCTRKLSEVIRAASKEDDEEDKAPIIEEIGLKEAVAIFLHRSDESDRKNMLAILNSMDAAEESHKKGSQFRAIAK